jgi:hypothetical protein
MGRNREFGPHLTRLPGEHMEFQVDLFFREQNFRLFSPPYIFFSFVKGVRKITSDVQTAC